MRWSQFPGQFGSAFKMESRFMNQATKVKGLGTRVGFCERIPDEARIRVFMFIVRDPASLAIHGGVNAGVGESYNHSVRVT